MAPMNSKASILNHAKVGRDCPQRGTAATEPREAFGVRRIPALFESSARLEAKAPEYGALQTLRAVRLRLCALRNIRVKGFSSGTNRFSVAASRSAISYAD